MLHRFPLLKHFSNSEELVVYIMQVLMFVGGFGCLIFATTWCAYFLNRINILRKKIYYLKKQTYLECFDDLRNAKVDYIRSLFMVGISVSESLAFVSICGLAVFHKIAKQKHNCSAPIFFELSYYYPVYRYIIAFAITCIITCPSLIHILTSYLSHAYNEQRKIYMMRREFFMFALLLIQLLFIWTSTFYWPLFILVPMIILVTVFPCHLYLYYKYNRQLYRAIRCREQDAWFEGIYSHKNLVKMLKNLKKGSILYFTLILLSATSYFILISTSIVGMTKPNDCLVKSTFHLNFNFSTGEEVKKLYSFIQNILCNIFFLLGIWFLFVLHASIMLEVIIKMFQRRYAYNHPTNFSRSIIYQPLIGNK